MYISAQGTLTADEHVNAAVCSSRRESAEAVRTVDREVAGGLDGVDRDAVAGAH